MKKTIKRKKYKGVFNWYGELHTLYTHAGDENKTFNNFITQLTKILKVSRSRVYYYFADDEKDNFKIEEVV